MNSPRHGLVSATSITSPFLLLFGFCFQRVWTDPVHNIFYQTFVLLFYQLLGRVRHFEWRIEQFSLSLNLPPRLNGPCQTRSREHLMVKHKHSA